MRHPHHSYTQHSDIPDFITITSENNELNQTQEKNKHKKPQVIMCVCESRHTHTLEHIQE